ncbi:Uncharacterised protein [Mesomycoplasma dispar]|uniref:Uncharacterized protein n=1 Tax=Mesomycoplasma dispar TaxID=86660 RepID=A0AAJ5NSB6_9BACT|nr:Uncharacterised protein [Mesomycoplasma dispar]
MDNFDLKKFINSVLVDTENCKKRKKSKKICWKYQIWLKRTSNLRRKIPLDNLFFTRHFSRLYYIRLKNRKEISEFDWVVNEMQNYYWFYTVIFAYIFNKEQKGFNRKKFFLILSKILFFYLLVIWILIFAVVFALFNDFQLISLTVSWKIISGISAVLVLFESIDLLKQFFIEWTYRRIRKRFFVNK